MSRRAPVVSYEVSRRIATVTLDRPDRGNALTFQMCAELVDAFDRADADDEVAAVVLRGNGRHFCVGADLEAGFHHRGSEPSHEVRAFVERFGAVDGVPRDAGGVVCLRIAAMLKPVIVAVNGAAVGGGASMTLPADVRVVSDSTRFGFVFARRGMVPESASSWFLPRLVGMTRAAEWVLTGRLLEAHEVQAAGLSTRLVRDDELLDTAYALATEIVEHTSTVASALARQLLWSMQSAASPWEAHVADSKAVYDVGAGEDVAEGVASFLAKRPPVFPLRVPRDYPSYGPRWPSVH
jgi:enoyl-CoA hydratase/carnithine racemase